MSSTQRSSKTVHVLKSPYSQPSWPSITSQVETSILDLVLPLLAPIGQHRERLRGQSKSKARRKKRKQEDIPPDEQSKRQDEKSITAVENEDPDIQQYLTVGFNSTVRQLEILSQKFRPKAEEQQGDSNRPVAPFVILVCISMLPYVMTAPLPVLAKSATLASQAEDNIRLVPISQRGAACIAGALGQPRANVLGILQGAPDSQGLQALVREKIEPMDVPWLRDVADRKYQPTQFQSEEVNVGEGKRAKRK